ncbi:hypothetical protein KW842_02175 [Duganella sp. sic0402]|uniref:hypothetical protein n=1 Tax=Duganella sp. sic0402 TaxID=2854786 RepID=UPI001C47A05F|nr:hypothetical protein [Duganella sp. sic0402]MBV7534565.1 hypothetical protein [Duganella sp. sic0402]
MTVEKTTAELLQEREGYPFGKPRPYSPNHKNILAEGLAGPQIEDMPLFSRKGKFILIFLAILLGLYCVLGLAIDDLFIPVKRSPGVHYRGIAAWLNFGMILSFSGCLITMAISKYEVAQRRVSHKTLLKVLCVSLMCFMLAGIVMGPIGL